MALPHLHTELTVALVSTNRTPDRHVTDVSLLKRLAEVIRMLVLESSLPLLVGHRASQSSQGMPSGWATSHQALW